MLGEGALNERVGLPMRCPVLALMTRLGLWPKPCPRQPLSVWSHGGSPGPVADTVAAHVVCGLPEPGNTVFLLGTPVFPLGGSRPEA